MAKKVIQSTEEIILTAEQLAEHTAENQAAIEAAVLAEQKAAAQATLILIPNRTYSQTIMLVIAALQQTGKTDDDMMVDILKIATDNVDESKLPLNRCTDNELNKRLSVVYGKKVPAKKAKESALDTYIVGQQAIDEDDREAVLTRLAGELTDEERAELTIKAETYAKAEETNTKLADAVTVADKAYADLLAEETEIKSYKSTGVRTGTLSTDNVDPSQLSQFDLGKLIRNYQSKKSTAKQAGDTKLEAYWQSKVDEAVKFRTTSEAGKKVAETNNKVNDIIKGLEAGPQTPEVLAMIAMLKAL